MSRQPSGADEVAYASGMAVLAVLTALFVLVALGFGMAGVLQRRCKRTFTFLGVACSVLFSTVLHARVGIGDLGSGAIAFFTEPRPKIQPPGNE